MDVLILAGSGEQTELTNREGVSNKSFISINGKYIISHVIESFQKTNSVARIAVVAPSSLLETLKKSYDIVSVVERESVLENLLQGVKVLKPEGLFLLANNDIPLVTPAAVEDFLEKCCLFESDFYYPIVEQKVCEIAYPGIQRTYLCLRDGCFTGGNPFLVNSLVVEKTASKVELFFKHRKQPLKLVTSLGFGAGFIAKFISGRLAIADLEEHFSKLFSLRAKAIISDFPEVAADIDKVSDLVLVRQAMSRQEN